MSDRRCVECGNGFKAKRRDARYCSPSCRKRAARARAAETEPIIGDSGRERRPVIRHGIDWDLSLAVARAMQDDWL